MRIERSASFLLSISVGVALMIAGCGSGGDGETAKVSPEVAKKTEDMLKGMQKKMQDQHQNAAKKGS